jgi:murein DD-endopeptidase MepM/ murein hydrolase activator NlpD
VTYVFPISPASVARYGRTHHDYPASDMFAPCGSAVVSPVSGRVSDVSYRDTWSASVDDGATRGGLSVAVVGDDGVRYYGSHLRRVTAGIRPGVRVAAGQSLGRVGDTGSAAGTGCHLHFGISPPCGTGDWQVRRGILQPAPYLDAWRAGRNTSPLAEVLAWRRSHRAQCP